MSGYDQTVKQRPRMLFKITVLGEGGVGKTALTVQFTMASFVETYDPTIEDCYRKQWTVDDQPCLLEVLDTAGQEEYTALRDQWIRDGEGFLVVYSVASRDTFDRVDSIVRRVRRVKDEAATMGGAYGGYSPSPYSPPGMARPPGRIPIVIIGNKRDMQHLRDVQPEEGASLARRLGCDFFETSAKNGHNVENAFKTVVRGIKAAKGIMPGNMAGPGGPVPAQMGGQQQPMRRRQRRNQKCAIL